MSTPETLQILQDEHHALSSMLQSLTLLVRRGPEQDSARFFDTVSAMLLYIDEFPEKLHHPKESELLFPRVALMAPQVGAVIQKLEDDHQRGVGAVRELQHLLLRWRYLGSTFAQAFSDALTRYVGFYRAHMDLEESQILPAAMAVLSARDWTELDQAFAENQDPLTKRHRPDATYEQLFHRIVHDAPAPIGLGG